MTLKPFYINQEVIDEVVLAVEKTFAQSLLENAEFIGVSSVTEDTFDFSGIVGMQQGSRSIEDAVLSCQFKKESVFYILEKLYQQKVNLVDRSCMHCAGEFTNIIYTRIKSSLNEKLGFDFQMAVPGVVLGNKEIVRTLSNAANSSSKLQDSQYMNFSINQVPFCVGLKAIKK